MKSPKNNMIYVCKGSVVCGHFCKVQLLDEVGAFGDGIMDNGLEECWLSHQ